MGKSESGISFSKKTFIIHERNFDKFNGVFEVKLTV